MAIVFFFFQQEDTFIWFRIKFIKSLDGEKMVYVTVARKVFDRGRRPIFYWSEGSECPKREKALYFSKLFWLLTKCYILLSLTLCFAMPKQIPYYTLRLDIVGNEDLTVYSHGFYHILFKVRHVSRQIFLPVKMLL
jgi:hypothetical protein